LRQCRISCFIKKRKKFYSQLLKHKSKVQSPPNLVALETFWRLIFENPTKANLDSSWLSDLRSKLADKLLIVEEPVIDENCFDGCVAKLHNFVVPGIQGFWIKHFTALRSVIASHFNNMLKDG